MVLHLDAVNWTRGTANPTQWDWAVLQRANKSLLWEFAIRFKGSGPTGPAGIFRGVLAAIMYLVGWEVVTHESNAERGERLRAEIKDIIDFLAQLSPYFQRFPENWLHFNLGSMSHPCIFIIIILSPYLPCLS